MAKTSFKHTTETLARENDQIHYFIIVKTYKRESIRERDGQCFKTVRFSWTSRRFSRRKNHCALVTRISRLFAWCRRIHFRSRAVVFSAFSLKKSALPFVLAFPSAWLWFGNNKIVGLLMSLSRPRWRILRLFMFTTIVLNHTCISVAR